MVTWNNPPEEGFKPDEMTHKPLYAIWQKEVGESGTPHLQMYLAYESPVRHSRMRTLLPGCHIEPRHGSHKQAKTYCSKLDSRVEGPYEYGDDTTIANSQGQRSDLIGAKRAIEDGASVLELFDSHFGTMVRYGRGMKEYKRLRSEKRMWPMEIIVLVGPTGCGKTRWCYDTFGRSLYAVPAAKSSGTYWDDYDGEETVLVDEMYGNRFSWGFLLQLCDRYPLKVPNHGGFINFSSKRIIFTSNSRVSDWYDQAKICIDPFLRRITHSIECIIPPPPTVLHNSPAAQNEQATFQGQRFEIVSRIFQELSLNEVTHWDKHPLMNQNN